MASDASDGGRNVKPGASSITGGQLGARSGVVAPPSGQVGKQTLTGQLGAGAATPAEQTMRDALAVVRRLLPAYQRAVSALDGMAALELAHNIVGALQLAAADKHPSASLGAELATVESELAIKLGPQLFDGAPVMGSVVAPPLAGDPIGCVTGEASLVVELLGVVAEVMRRTGARIGACPVIAPATAQSIIELVEPWKSRPVNFAFLVAALRKLGVWDEVSSVKSSAHGKTLAATQQAVAAQAQETGALADVGDLDREGLSDLLREDAPGTPGIKPGLGRRIDDDVAQKLLERLAAAAPNARGPLVVQIGRTGKLAKVCDHLPWKAIQQLHDAIAPFDPAAAAMLVPFYAGKGGGESMHKIYENKIMEHLHDDHMVRAFLWTYLDTAHNALTMGFEHEYSQAYDAHEAGVITDDAMVSAGGKALGKAAAIMLASAATGGAAGAFGEGFAAGLGASKPIASLIGAGVGGFGAGVGGHLAGDVFDQRFNGKQGFDSFGSYMRSGAEGGAMGVALGGLSVGAGKYLGGRGGAARPVDDLAARYPASAGVLERLRAAGFGFGADTRVAGAEIATKLKVTAAELSDMLASGLAVPRPAFATALGRLPPGSQLEIAVRPQPMQMASSPPPGGRGSAGGSIAGAGTGGSHAGGPKLEIDDVKPAEATAGEAPAAAKAPPEDQLKLESPEPNASRATSGTRVPGEATKLTPEQRTKLSSYVNRFLPDPAARADVLDTVARVEQQPRISGLDDWLEFSLNTTTGGSKPLEVARNLVDDVNELKIAIRKVEADPAARVEVGNDAHTRPTPNGDGTLPSFDLGVDSGDVHSNVEVKTNSDDSLEPADLGAALKHAAQKVVGEAFNGQPVSEAHRTKGPVEAALVTTWPPPPQIRSGGTVVVDMDGNVALKTSNGLEIPNGNIFKNYLKILNGGLKAKAPVGIDKVDVLAVYDRSGSLVKRFVKGPDSVWKLEP